MRDVSWEPSVGLGGRVAEHPVTQLNPAVCCCTRLRVCLQALCLSSSNLESGHAVVVFFGLVEGQILHRPPSSGLAVCRELPLAEAHHIWTALCRGGLGGRHMRDYDSLVCRSLGVCTSNIISSNGGKGS